jgi:hypothetical protein
MAEHNFNLPADSQEWARVVDKDGWTVAHAAAERGRLPEGFTRWDIVNKYGRTVAHEAAKFGPLPKGFNRWDLADKNGRTVAHEAVWCGPLPKGFNQWELADKYGRTVAHAAAEYGHPRPQSRKTRTSPRRLHPLGYHG